MKIKIGCIIFFSVLLTTFSLYTYQILYRPNILVQQKDSMLIIPYKMTFKQLQKKLYEENIVQNMLAFSIVARWMKFDKNLKPGHYKLKKGMNNLETIKWLRAGKQHPVNITFSNIRTLKDLAEKITHNIGLTSEQFLTLLQDENFLQQYDLNKHTVKAIFIPNTYQVYWTYNAKQVFKKIYDSYQKFWNNKRRLQAKKIGLTPIEVCILASIIEEETNNIQEYPIIAGVFMKRLKRGMRLQSCTTLRYAMQNFSCKRVLYKHINIISPYNTYIYKGLPPGPIRMSSIKAIEAVLYYTKHNYLYFSAQENFSGKHNFSKTLKEHSAKAMYYKRVLNKKKIFK